MAQRFCAVARAKNKKPVARTGFYSAAGVAEQASEY